MKTMTATEFKAKCLSLMDQVARTGEGVIILKRGRAVAQLVVAPSADEECPQKSLHGSVKILGDIIGPVLPPEAWDALGKKQ